MDMGLFKRITREMREAGVEEIGVFYLGESLMEVDKTVEAIRHCKDIGFPYVFLTTNGSLCNGEVAKRLMEAGLDSLKFSVNAADRDQFAEIMGVSGRWMDIAIKNLQQTWAVRESFGFHTRIYASSIQYDGEQQQRMEELVRDCVAPYVDEHYWLPLYGQMAHFKEGEGEWMRPTAGNQGRIGGLVAPLPCWSVFSEGHVRADGNFSLCCFSSDDRYDVGDLKEQSFMDVWHNEYFQSVRGAHLNKDLRGTVCEECVAWQE